MKSLKRCLLLSLVVLVAGCGEIEKSSRLAQSLDESLIAGVGDTIIEVETRESLPNIAGKADLWGRTRPTGKIIVIYLGLQQGRAVFERTNIWIQSSATTMNSSPIIVPQTSTTTFVGNTSIGGANAVASGTATTIAPPVVLPSLGSKTAVISNNRIRRYLDLGGEQKLIVHGYEVLVKEATASFIKYRIEKLERATGR